MRPQAQIKLNPRRNGIDLTIIEVNRIQSSFKDMSVSN
jgi:hypothetical protein